MKINRMYAVLENNNIRMTTMKKFFSCLLIAIMLLLTSTSVFADDDLAKNTKSIYVPEAKATIEVPADWIIITLTTTADDPACVNNELDVLSAQQYMKQTNSVLCAVNPTSDQELQLVLTQTKESTQLIDYRTMPEQYEEKILNSTTQLKEQLSKTLPKEYTINRVAYTEVLKNEQAKYFMIDRSITASDGFISNSYSATTMIDKKVYAYSFFSYNQEITDYQKAQVKELAKKIKYDQSVHDTYQSAVNNPQKKYYTFGRITDFMVLVLIVFGICMLIVKHMRKKRGETIQQQNQNMYLK